MPDTFNSGAVLDTRPPEAKAKDWTQKEVVAGAGNIQWTEKPQSAWRKFPIFNQDGSGSCVAQTEAKEMGIMRSLKDGTYVHFSATDCYQRRSNRPGTGMIADDARKIAAKGITLEVLANSQNLSDAQMDAVTIEQYKHDVGTVFAVPNHLALPTQNIDAVASTIQATGKGVMVWFYFLINEWTERPSVLDSSLQLAEARALKHSVTAVDFTMQGNDKCLIIDDSWGSSFGMAGQRVITESFYNKRNWFADYLINFKFDEQATPKPQHHFTVELEFGMTSLEVKALQDCLKYDGEFPLNADSTGYFGAITKKAVGDYQLKHGILTNTTGPGYGRVGPVTMADLNIRFA